MASAGTAARAALAQSGLGWDDLGVLELAGTTLFDEILLLESIGLAETGEGCGHLPDRPPHQPVGRRSGR